MRAFIDRWLRLRNACEDVGDAQAITAFTNGLQEGSMLGYALRLADPKELGEMLTIANKHASAVDDARGHGINIDNVSNVPRKGNFQQKKKQNIDDKEVAAAFGKPGPGKGGNNNNFNGKCGK